MSTLTEPTWRQPSTPHWTTGTLIVNWIIGLGLIGAGQFFMIAWLTVLGAGVLIYAQLERAWHKTIRPAIIELIREALR